MPTVYFVKQDRAIECPAGTNLRKLALENGIDLYAFPHNLAHCRGFGLCGTCRVKVDNPRSLSAPTRQEEWKVGWEGPEYRLACQATVQGDVEVITNPRKKLGWMEHPTYHQLRDMEY